MDYCSCSGGGDFDYFGYRWILFVLQTVSLVAMDKIIILGNV